MATDNWTGGDSLWNTAADWSAEVPKSTTAVSIAAGTPEIDDSVGSVKASSVDISASGAGLDLEGGGGLNVMGAVTNSGALGIDEVNGDQGSSLTVGGNLTNSGTIDVDTANYSGGGGLTVDGTLTNTGSGALDIGDYNLQAATTVTLGGLTNTGTTTLISNTSVTADFTTLNSTGSVTNSGSLTIGANSVFDVTNSGTFTQTAGTTTVEGTFTADTVDVNGGTFAVDVLNFSDLAILEVADGGTLTFAGGGGLANLSGTTLNSGKYIVDAGSTFQLANNAEIVTDNAYIVLSGAGSILEDYDTSTSAYVTIDQTLSTIGAKGTLRLLAPAAIGRLPPRSPTTGSSISAAGR